MERPILLNPGPVNLSRRVRAALTKPDLCHREPEFSALQDSIRKKLLNVYGLSADDWAAVLLTGSGTAAVEAMITSLVPELGRLLILENGVYGERISHMASVYGLTYKRLEHDWTSAININRLETELSEQRYSHLAMVHHETTTGRLNKLADVIALCKQYNVKLLLDAVSSFGAEEIHFETNVISACAATANKCLHSVPGMSFVLLDRTAINASDLKTRSLYLDLKRYLDQQDEGGTPFTQSVQCFYAIDEALNELENAGGHKKRLTLYQSRMSIIREGFRKLGIKPLYENSDCSSVLQAYQLPDGFSYQAFHDALKTAGFVIYAGQGELARSIFRISVMGEITEDDMHRLVAVVGEIIG